jgi:hypothetical protein
MSEEQRRVPVICAAPSSLPGAAILNGNGWEGRSRLIVQSCWSEYSVLQYSIGQVQLLAAEAMTLCRTQIEGVEKQWELAPFSLDSLEFFAEQPVLHLHIECMLSATKTLLDLIVLLLNTEGVVRTRLNGFNRDKNTYGGRVLNALGNPAKDRADAARLIAQLLREHKAAWIDQAIWARDQLHHPSEGGHQLMFQLQFDLDGKTIRCSRITPPFIGSMSAPDFAALIGGQVMPFAQGFLELVKRPSAGT